MVRAYEESEIWLKQAVQILQSVLEEEGDLSSENASLLSELAVVRNQSKTTRL